MRGMWTKLYHGTMQLELKRVGQFALLAAVISSWQALLHRYCRDVQAR